MEERRPDSGGGGAGGGGRREGGDGAEGAGSKCKTKEKKEGQVVGKEDEEMKPRFREEGQKKEGERKKRENGGMGTELKTRDNNEKKHRGKKETLTPRVKTLKTRFL